MDILISSNLERLIYLMTDAETTSGLMKQLSETGRYELPNEAFSRICDVFKGFYADEDDTAKAIRKYFDEAYERCRRLQELELSGVDVDMFTAVSNSLMNDGCGLYRGRLILPYEHLSRFQNDLID